MMKKAILLGASIVFMLTGLKAQSLDDARKAIDEEQYSRAKGILENLIQKQPKKGENYFYLGQIYLKNDYLDSAKMVFEKGQAADAKNQLNAVGLGIVELFSGNQSAAEKYFADVAAKVKKKDYVELYQIGRAYVDAPEPDYGRAMQYLTQSLQRAGKKPDPLIHLALGDAYFGTDQRSPAYSSYRDAIALNPNLTRAEVQMAVIIRGSRAWNEAITDFEAIIAKKPNYAPTYRELAETYNAWAFFATDTTVYRERNETAVKYYKQYMDLTDYSVESRIRYADFLVFARDYDELMKQAQELSQYEDINPKILRYLGHASYHKKDYQQAEDALTKMMSRMEAERVISRDYLYLGLAKLKNATTTATTNTAAFDSGIANIRKAVEVDSTSADDLNVTGREFLAANKFLESAKVFEISSGTEGSRNQVTDTYYFGLASYFANANNINKGEPKDLVLLEKADKAFEYVIEKAPDLLDPYLYRARNLSLKEEADNFKGYATAHYEKYIEIVKSKGPEEVEKNKAALIEIYNTMAYQFVQVENFEKAKELLTETMKLDPANEYAQQVLAYIEQVIAYNASSR
jgi:predicted Zn-dependent protease